MSDASESLDLLEELAEPIAEQMLRDYTSEDWHSSPVVSALARVSALLEVDGREVPLPVLRALRTAAEVRRPTGII